MTNNMIAQVESLPELIRSEFHSLDEKVRLTFNHNEILSTKKIIITGCGDSYFAGLATELAYASLSGIPTEVLTSMQFARYSAVYQAKSFPMNPLVIGVSVSGSVARTIEALQIARTEGAMTLGVTANPGSPVGMSAMKVLDCTIPSFPDAPGVRSYRASMLSLFLLAIRFGEIRNKLSRDEADILRRKLKGTADVIEQTIAANQEKIKDLAQRLSQHKNYVFVGHGPNLGTAWFSAAKIVEATGRHATGQDTEEYAHLQYFITVDSDTPTFVITPMDRGYGRMLEMMEPMKRVGRTTIAVVQDGEQKVSDWADIVLPVCGETPEIYTPMVYSLAGEIFAGHLAEILGEGYFGSSFQPYALGNNTIRSSKVIDKSGW